MMNCINYVIWNMNGNYHDQLMDMFPSWVTTEQAYDDYISMMTGN